MQYFLSKESGKKVEFLHFVPHQYMTFWVVPVFVNLRFSEKIDDFSCPKKGRFWSLRATTKKNLGILFCHLPVLTFTGLRKCCEFTKKKKVNFS